MLQFWLCKFVYSVKICQVVHFHFCVLYLDKRFTFKTKEQTDTYQQVDLLAQHISFPLVKQEVRSGS